MSYTIFDTNGYRELTYNKNILELDVELADLVSREKSKNIQGLANPFVMLELTSHLANSTDLAYTNCLHSVYALTKHCLIENDGNDMIAIMADSESQLCKILFEEIPLNHSKSTENISKICKYLSQDTSEEHIEAIREDLIEIQSKVLQIEEGFINDMMNYIVQGFDPTATDWNPLKSDKTKRKKVLAFLNSEISLKFLASALVVKSANLLQKTIDQSELDSMRDFVFDKFQTPLFLYNEIAKRIITTGCDLTKKNRSNWIWDIQISFSAGLQHTINGNSVTLVTGDKDIIEAANKSGCRDFVKSLNDYRISLNYV